MTAEFIETLIVGGGQAGLAMSEHLTLRGLPHLVIERDRIAESWRTKRWDSLVANGPAWHDRFPTLEFSDLEPQVFAPKDRIVAYFEDVAARNKTPLRCGVEVSAVTKRPEGGFRVQTSQGVIAAKNVVAATGPFQRPLIPAVVPPETGITQMHSTAYRNPTQLPDGAVMVVGAGSSGTQIADELLRAGKRVFLSIGPHDRPPIRYRGRDFCWWLGVLGMWDAKTREPGMEHVTIAVSGAQGGNTVDFRRFAARGMTLLGRAGPYEAGVMRIAPDLARNIENGDAHYLSVLRKADAYVAAHGLDMPLEPEAYQIDANPDCVTNPLSSVDLAAHGVTTIIWATGFSLDFGWLGVGRYDAKGAPLHERGVTEVPGLYFLGLSWLSCRASAFIWGVYKDAGHLAAHIATRG